MGTKNVSTEQVIEYLKANRWHRTKVAQLMGVSLETIRNHMKKAKQMGIAIHRSGYDASNPESKGKPPVIGQAAGTGVYEKPITHFPQEHQEDLFRSPVTHVPIDEDRRKRAEPFGNRIGLHLAEGNLEAAKRMVDVAFAELADQDNAIESLAETSITDVGIPLRTVNILIDDHGVGTLDDLLHVYHAALLATPNFGARSIDLVWRAVLNHCIKQDARLRARLGG